MKVSHLAIAASVAALGSLASANATTINLFNTGVDAAGVPLANGAVDAHYTLVSGPVGSILGAPRAATSANGFPIPPWIGDDAASAWIGPQSGGNLTGPEGDYDYRTTFVLGAGSAATAAIAGRWSSDNGGVDIVLNGVSTGQTTINQFASFTNFALFSGFKTGVNTLDFIVNNAPGAPDQNPTGVRVEMTGTSVPEPATWALMLVGFGGMGAMVRGGRKAQAAA